MKKYLIVLILMCCIGNLLSQTFYDPYVGTLTMSPNSPFSSIVPPFVPVTGTATVIIGSNSTGNSPIQWGSNITLPDGPCTSSGCKLSIRITTTSPYTEITAIPSAGTWVNKFTWLLSNSYLLIGTAKDSTSGGSIAVNSSGTIVIPIRHIKPSTVSDPVGQTHPCSVPGNNCTTGFTQGYNGVVVNLQPPSVPSVDDQPTANDNNGAYVYARTLLPISELKFSAQLQSINSAILDWSTLTEYNTKEFVIERMMDSEKEFKKVGIVGAIGNSTKTTNYNLVDHLPDNFAKAYYRIKQMDQNESFIYSQIKVVSKLQDKFSVLVYPNPTSSSINFQIESRNDDVISKIQLYDQLGRKLKEHSFVASKGSNLVQIPIEELPSGTYIVQVSGKDVSESLRVIKQ